ncbi:Epoxide hydrolase 4 [Cricetulus griseus]|uniref:Epoxide hydrolase 4 n=1 Tax=Cricetulus griseus TaxID=10029 RepID=G3HEB8_CRIGR|nr:Epoxide hydrolase 4 [Cricetulus griseus]
MAPPRPPRLVPALRALLYWSLVYGYCGRCASVHLLKLLWSIGKAPAQTFRRAARANPPACLNDPSLGTHCYVRIKDSGLRFHYVAAGERGRPLMLLLHGFPEFWYSWRHQLREFKSEYRVVALDLRGYGESDAPTHQESYKLDCLIADIKDVLDTLGYSKCVLIGHDWGGMIAWLISICYPEMIMKLVVINFPHPSVFTDFPDDSQANVFCFYSCLPLKHHMVTTPTLLLWGEEDAFMEAEMAEVTKTYVKNYFRLTVLSEGSHWLQQDQPDIVNRLIWAFLREERRE